jgi:hypothetical protein
MGNRLGCGFGLEEVALSITFCIVLVISGELCSSCDGLLLARYGSRVALSGARIAGLNCLSCCTQWIVILWRFCFHLHACVLCGE